MLKKSEPSVLWPLLLSAALLAFILVSFRLQLGPPLPGPPDPIVHRVSDPPRVNVPLPGRVHKPTTAPPVPVYPWVLWCKWVIDLSTPG